MLTPLFPQQQAPQKASLGRFLLAFVSAYSGGVERAGDMEKATAEE